MLPPAAERIEKRALPLGAFGVLVCLYGMMRGNLSQSYLIAYLFWLSLPLGSAALLMIYHLTGGNWGLVIRRMLEAATRTLPLMGILFLPLLYHPTQLYEWADPAKVAVDDLLKHKQPYLNVQFFVIRTVLYFAIWSALAIWFGRLSRLQDQTGDHELTRRMRRLSAPGILLFALTVTFFAFDWLMSLDPHWYSTIFGVYFFAGSAMAFFASAKYMLVLES